MATTRTVGRPVGVDSDETRQHILTVARACFVQHGYAATTYRMIGERAGLTTASVYHHFGRKPELFGAVSEATEGPVFERMRAAVDAHDSFVGKFHAILQTTHDMLTDNPDVAAFGAAVRADVARHQELRDLTRHGQFSDLFAEIAKTGVKTGEIDDAVAVQGAISAVSLGAAFLGSEVRISTHRAITDALIRLIDDTLIRRDGRPEGNGRRKAPRGVAGDGRRR
jgi:AcrR family transcriptional regulator